MGCGRRRSSSFRQIINIHLRTCTVGVGVPPARTLGLEREGGVGPPIGVQQEVLDLGMGLGKRGWEGIVGSSCLNWTVGDGAELESRLSSAREGASEILRQGVRRSWAGVGQRGRWRPGARELAGLWLCPKMHIL